MTEFFQTRMGQQFYESNIPKLLKALERIATALEKIIELQEKNGNDPSLTKDQS